MWLDNTAQVHFACKSQNAAEVKEQKIFHSAIINQYTVLPCGVCFFFYSWVRRSCIIQLRLASPLRGCQHTAVSWTQKTQQLVWQRSVCLPGQTQAKLKEPRAWKLHRMPDMGSDIWRNPVWRGKPGDFIAGWATARKLDLHYMDVKVYGLACVAPE